MESRTGIPPRILARLCIARAAASCCPCPSKIMRFCRQPGIADLLPAAEVPLHREVRTTSCSLTHTAKSGCLFSASRPNVCRSGRSGAGSGVRGRAAVEAADRESRQSDRRVRKAQIDSVMYSATATSRRLQSSDTRSRPLPPGGEDLQVTWRRHPVAHSPLVDDVSRPGGAVAELAAEIPDEDAH